MIIQILIPQRHPNTRCPTSVTTLCSMFGIAKIVKAPREPIRQSDRMIPPQQQHPSVRCDLAAIKCRQHRPAFNASNSNSSAVHCVCIGVPSGVRCKFSLPNNFSDSAPRCTYNGEISGLAAVLRAQARIARIGANRPQGLPSELVIIIGRAAGSRSLKDLVGFLSELHTRY